MLVLTRKQGEQVWIGEFAVLTVLEVSKGQVRLGFAASENVTILREEVHQKYRTSKMKASKTQTPVKLDQLPRED